MEASRFDALTRSFSVTRSRRSIARLLGGLAVGGGIGNRTVQQAFAALRNGGTPCTKNSQCTTGRCLKSGTCSCSSKFLTCKQPGNPCQQASCNVETKRCVTRKKTNGTPCTVGGFGGTCVYGECTDCGRINQGCCTNGICGAGGTCVGFPFRCVPCGDLGQPCCDPAYCAEGECTVHRTCGSCGGLNEQCCIQGTCDVQQSPLTCRSTDLICVNA